MRSLLTFIVAALMGALGIVTVHAGTAYAAGQTGAPTDRLQVWNLNTHHMRTDSSSCGTSPCTDYREFIAYITDPARVAYVPDIVTLQEAGTASLGVPSCQQFVTDLQNSTGGLDYHCYETAETGGSAIAYRTGRLSYVGGTMQEVQLKTRANADADCTTLSNWYALVLRLKDDLDTSKFINVASVHLPVVADNASNPDADCAWENTKSISSAVQGLGSASMQIMAGDWNHLDGTLNSSGQVAWECWYKGTNVDYPGTCGTTVANLGWKDAMYRACGGDYNCLDANHWTHASTRIDFLFVKTYAVYNQVTVDYALARQSAGGAGTLAPQYSDHRGQGALLRYY
ncbi:hypothetical protein GCM10010406_26070 [Streptomyces thermolineatus]|uniref:Endonuclease/exonuclease/phosphatase family protein n=1 Tax=Streptomyces thermolineatus TaxID=44033 RepID=A0ABN3LQX6_9ACTN